MPISLDKVSILFAFLAGKRISRVSAWREGCFCMKHKLEKVLEPINIGSVRIKNRMIHMGSHGSVPQDDKGDAPISPTWVDFYEGLAAGGFGLVSVGGGIIKLDKTSTYGVSTVESNFEFEGLQILANVIHKHGAAAFWQLICGYPTRQYDQSDYPSLCSSSLSQEDLNGLIPYYNPTTELTVEQIDIITSKFAETAELLQKAGFDGVEINAGHNHGLNTFLSPAWNHRTDQYGGSPENRARIVCEIDQKIKERCGKDFAVINNLSGAEYNVEGGRSVADTVEIAKCFEAAGADAIHSRYEMFHEAVPEYGIPRTSHEEPDIDLFPGYLDQDLSEYGIDNSFGKGVFGWSGAAAAIKQAVNIPVSVSGRTDAFVGEELIRAGKLDLISICRRAHADYDYCKKVTEGRYEDIRPCIGCNTCYDMSAHSNKSWCMVNPTALERKEYATIDEAETKKRVLVIGSGAAGLESARVAALRGHEVILCEQEPSLGGTLPLAGMMNDFHEDFLAFSQWQVRQVEKLGVDIRTKTKVDEAYVKKVQPDAIIVAVGSAENLPNIPGMDKKIVVTGADLHKQLKRALKLFSIESLGKLSKLYLPLGKKVILIGGGIQGLQTAHFLMMRGREVVIVEESDELGTGMIDCGPKPNMIRWLVRENVEMHVNVKCKEITDDGLVIIEDGEEKLITGDSVVTTLQMLPNPDLYERLKDMAPEVYAVGDCNPLVIDKPYPPSKIEPVDSKPAWPRYTVTAIREAFRIARYL